MEFGWLGTLESLKTLSFKFRQGRSSRFGVIPRGGTDIYAHSPHRQTFWKIYSFLLISDPRNEDSKGFLHISNYLQTAR